MAREFSTYEPVRTDVEQPRETTTLREVHQKARDSELKEKIKNPNAIQFSDISSYAGEKQETKPDEEPEDSDFMEKQVSLYMMGIRNMVQYFSENKRFLNG